MKAESLFQPARSGEMENMNKNAAVMDRILAAARHTFKKRTVLILILCMLSAGVLEGCGQEEGKADSVLQVTLVGADSLEAEKSSLVEDYRKAAGYADDETLTMDTSLYYDSGAQDQRSASSLQILAAQFLSGEIDVFAGEEELFEKEAENHAFLNLEEVLPESVLEDYRNDLIYSEDESDGESRPLGILLKDTRLTKNHLYRQDQVIAIGVGSRSDSPEEAGNFITYLLTGQTDGRPDRAAVEQESSR